MKKGFLGSYMYHPPDMIISVSNIFQVKAAHYHPRPFWLVITERKTAETTNGWMAEWSKTVEIRRSDWLVPNGKILCDEWGIQADSNKLRAGS
jgi:hypothetical protein